MWQITQLENGSNLSMKIASTRLVGKLVDDLLWF